MGRSPILSETDAFGLTVAGAVAVLAGVLAGWLASALAGVVVFAALVVVGVLLLMSRSDPGRRLPLRRAAREHHRHGALPGTRHVIVVANATLCGDELAEHVRGLGAGGVELDVLAPVLTSRTHLAYTDVDAETRQARDRLSRSLNWAWAQGFAARGEIGDPSAGMGLEDALRDFGADEVIVVTGQAEPAHWQERSELERLRKELDVPVVQIVAAPIAPADASA